MLLHVAVITLVAILAAATFVVSYAGIRDLAVAAGQPWRVARLYPVILDAVLVVACAAAALLRDASLWRRLYAWACLVVLVGAVGAADAIHAMRVVLPHRPEAGTAAALPWALVMLGFSLWLTMMHHARSGSAPQEPRVAEPPAPSEQDAQMPAPASPAPAAPAPALPKRVPRAWPDGQPRSSDETPEAAPLPLRRVRSTPLPPED